MGKVTELGRHFGSGYPVIYVDTIADLQALTTSELVDGQAARIATTSRSGDFVWRPSDQSANISSDPESGVWVAPSGESGASGAWERQYEGPIIPQWFGATGDGAVDDSIAVAAACKYAQGSSVYFGASDKTYILRDTYSKNPTGVGERHGCLPVYSNTSYLADGATLKIKDGAASTTNDINLNVFLIADNTTISGCTWSGIRFDMNGYNNRTTTDKSSRLNFAAIFVTGDNSVIDDSSIIDCEVFNTQGKTCIGLGQTNATGTDISRNCSIIRCTFRDNALDTDDHSSIYGWCEDLTIRDCTFEQFVDTSSHVGACCIEVHGRDTMVTGCHATGFYFRFAFVGSNYTRAASDIELTNNIIRTYGQGFTFFRKLSSQTSIRSVIVANNNITLDPIAGVPGSPEGVSCKPIYGCSDVQIYGNVVTAISSPVRTYGVFVGNGVADNPVARIYIYGNNFYETTDGVYVTSSDGVIDDIDVRNNTLLNPTAPDDASESVGFAFYGESANKIGAVILMGNSLIDARATKVAVYGIEVTYTTSMTLSDNYRLDATTESIRFQRTSVDFYYGDQARKRSGKPVYGTWVVGDRVENTNPSVLTGTAGTYILDGWVCTVSGTPGTWEPLQIPTSY